MELDLLRKKLHNFSYINGHSWKSWMIPLRDQTPQFTLPITTLPSSFSSHKKRLVQRHKTTMPIAKMAVQVRHLRAQLAPKATKKGMEGEPLSNWLILFHGICKGDPCNSKSIDGSGFQNQRQRASLSISMPSSLAILPNKSSKSQGKKGRRGI